MKRKYNIIMVCMIVGIAVTSCTDSAPKEVSGTSAEFKTETSALLQFSNENYNEEVEEMYRAYLDAYLRNDGRAVAEFYDEYLTTARESAQSEEGEKERKNVLSAEFYHLIEVPLDEEEYRFHFRENPEFEPEKYEAIRAYLVGVDMRVNEIGRSNYNGVNYKYRIVGRKDGEWKFIPWYQNGGRFISDYIAQAYKDCEDEEEKRYLNVAYINRNPYSICIDGDGSVVEGTEEEITRFNEWLQNDYKIYGIDGFMLEFNKNYNEEVEEMYRAYLDAYLRNDGKAVAEFYDEYLTTARESAQSEEGEKERKNVLSAEFYHLIEVPLDEEGYRFHFRENPEFEPEKYEAIRAYLVGVDMRVNEVGQSNYNGVNYKYRIVGRKDGEWKFVPWHINGSGIIRDYMMRAYKDCEDEEEKRYLNIAYINYHASSVCVDGDGSVVEGTEDEVAKFNEYLKHTYKSHRVDGLLLEKK